MQKYLHRLNLTFLTILSVLHFSFTANDLAAPGFNSSNVINITDVQFTLRVNVDQDATVYYVVTTSSTAPSTAQIAAGDDENGDPAFKSGNAAASDGVNLDQAITGLTPATQYYVHFFAENAGAEQSAVVTISATTIVGAPTGGSFSSSACVDNGTVTFSAPSSGQGFTYLVFVKPMSAVTIGTPTQDPTTYAAPTTNMANSSPAYENDPTAILVFRGNSVPGSISLTGLATNLSWTTFHVAIFNVKDNTTYSSALTFSGSRAATTTVGNITAYTATPQSASAGISFNNPASCFDQVMIVAGEGSAPTMDVPVGTSFTADSNFGGSGTALNSGKVVYYAGGATSAAQNFTVTGLTNDVEYHFRYFVRKGVVWEVGTSISTTPGAVPVIVSLTPPDNSIVTTTSLTNAVLTFDVNVEEGVFGGGVNNDARSARLYRASDNVQIAEVDRTGFNISGQTVTIPFGAALTDNTNYYIQIGPNAIRKAPGSTAFPGIANTTTWNFSVVLYAADAGPDRTICQGESTTLLGAALGGNGFNSFSWSPATGLSCTTCPNPTASPATTTVYTLTVNNNLGEGPKTDEVTVTVNDKPTVGFDPSTRTTFIVSEDPYQLQGTATPPDGTGVFSGTGVVQHGDGYFYFHPDAAGVQNDIPITYTHTNPNGCSNSVTIEFDVSSQSPVLNLKPAYCANEGIDNTPSGILAPNPVVINTATYRYMRFLNAAFLEIGEFDPNNPLIEVTANPKTYRFDPLKASAALAGDQVGYVAVYNEFNIFGIPFILRTAVVEVRVYRPGIVPFITWESNIFCENDNPIVLQTNIGNAYTTLSWDVLDYFTNTLESPDGITEPVPGQYMFDPSEITFPSQEPFRYFNMRYRYNDLNGCSGQTQQIFAVVRKPAPPVGPNMQYCQFFDGKLTLSASGEWNYIRWYENSNLSDPNPPITTTFDTGLNPNVPQSKTYYVTDDYFGYCESNPAQITIQVTPIPDFDLTFAPQCENKTFHVSGPTQNVISYLWNMGNNDTFTTQAFDYTYSSPGQYNVSLDLVYDSNGLDCKTRETATINVGQNPMPDFTFNQLCDGDFTQFNGTSSITVEKFSWDFGNGNILMAGNNASSVPGGTHGGNTTGTFQNPRHKYVHGTLPQTDTVIVWAYTSNGCFDSLRKAVTILPYLTFGPATPYIQDDIDSGKGFWSVEDINGNSTWEFSQANGSIIATTSEVWVTNATGNYLSNDRSYLNSPCFNLGSFERPVVSMDYILNTEFTNFDGVSFEYSTDGGLMWNALGSTSTGAKWFNTQGFFSGNIGNSQVGWSGNLWDEDQGQINWRQGKHKLDGASTNKVRFRLAFVSNNDAEYEGFAFTNLRIEERNRLALVENFTNAQFTTNNSSFNTIPSTEAVKLQYHLAYPTADNINLSNQPDPSARAAFYGIPYTTQYVPRGFIDGFSEGNFTSPTWVSATLDTRALSSSPYSIQLSTLDNTSDPDQLKIRAVVNELLPVGAAVLYVAVVEKTVGTNQFVVRKLLPSAAGVALEGLASELFEFDWKPQQPSIDPDNLAVAAFIQDHGTKEVHQAAILMNPPNLPNGIVTGLEDPEFSNKILLYPNPANHELNVVLPEPATERIPMLLIDAQGRPVYEGNFDAGQQHKTILTSDFAGGVYILQISVRQQMARKKVMILHQGN